MPIYAQQESKTLWNSLRKTKKHARSLASSRFVDLPDGDESGWRQLACDSIRDGQAHSSKPDAYVAFAQKIATSAGGELVLAKLQARMIINSAGGTFENGGICLDRCSGVPFIPGSAVKGVTRAQALLQVSCIEDPAEKISQLAAFCRIFGWADQEWKPGRKENSTGEDSAFSDLWLAMAPSHEGRDADNLRKTAWAEIAEKVAHDLLSNIGKKAKEGRPATEQMPSCAGSVCFLPAFPDTDPGIDIDILTPHHPDYYQNEKDVATDDESPNPVLFPTVRPGKTFAFPLVPSGRNRPEDLALVKDWLIGALEIRGVGAKTNAGYGWFTCERSVDADGKAEDTQIVVEEVILSTSERLASLNDNMFADKVRILADLDSEEQEVVCQLLADERSHAWKKWCGEKKGKWPPRLDAIRDIAKLHSIKLP